MILANVSTGIRFRFFFENTPQECSAELLKTVEIITSKRIITQENSADQNSRPMWHNNNKNLTISTVCLVVKPKK